MKNEEKLPINIKLLAEICYFFEELKDCNHASDEFGRHFKDCIACKAKRLSESLDKDIKGG